MSMLSTFHTLGKTICLICQGITVVFFPFLLNYKRNKQTLLLTTTIALPVPRARIPTLVVPGVAF